MKIAVISDTHGVLKEELKDILQASDCVIHAGDIGSLRVYQQLKQLNTHTYFVKGNCDNAAWAVELPLTLSLHIDAILFYIIHNQTGFGFCPAQADIIVCGHTHRYQQGSYHGSILLNPGSCAQPRDGAASCAVITTQDGAIQQIKRVILSA